MKDVWQLVVFGGIGAVLFLPLVVSDSMFFPFITGKNFGFRIIVEITLAAWILLALYEPAYRPRFSWLLPSMGALLVVMFLANILGEYAPKSFWSNYERMDGYVTLVHFAAYFLILGSVLSHRTISFFGQQATPWFVFMLTALVAAVCVSFTAFQQLAGTLETTMGWRINGTLGNASYMAIYMLFNVFVALWVALHSRQTWLRVTGIALAALFVFLLLQTATRGTILGLTGGTFLGALYIAIFNTQFPRIRKVAIAMVVTVTILVSALIIFRESDVVKGNIILNRATKVNLAELDLRITIWNMGLEGIAERPLLGWGQGNFNYIFNEQYDPSIAGRAEEWYDRGHNIFVDWLSAGGILGLIAYLSVWAAAAYYVLVAPHRKRSDTAFSVTERGLLLGIFSGYFIHNLVVFDNIVSYIFFAIILALVHSRVSESSQPWPARSYDAALITNVVTPVVLIVTALTVYFVNVPSIQAAQDIIDAYRAQQPSERLEAFRRAFAREGLAQQELTEQLTQQAMQLSSNRSVDEATQQAFLAEAESRLLTLLAEKPGDARIHVFAASFYRAVGNIAQAREQAALARQFTPEKPSALLEQGFVEYQANNLDGMLEYFAGAYELNPNNRQAQVTYAAGLLLAGAQESVWREVLSSEVAYQEFLLDRLTMMAANQTENYSLLEDIFALQVDRNPANAQSWISLAFAQYRQGDVPAAIATLEETALAIPEVASATECFAENIAAGREPQEGC